MTLTSPQKSALLNVRKTGIPYSGAARITRLLVQEGLIERDWGRMTTPNTDYYVLTEKGEAMCRELMQVET